MWSHSHSPLLSSHILQLAIMPEGESVSLWDPTDYFKFQSKHELNHSLKRNVSFPYKGNFML